MTLSSVGLALTCCCKGMAKGLPYPGSGCIPPWARLSETPAAFFDLALIPDGIRISDPSRMNVEPINRCLQFWLNAEPHDSFRFHHIWSETKGDFEAALKPLQSEDTEDGQKLRNTGKSKAYGTSSCKGKAKQVEGLKESNGRWLTERNSLGHMKRDKSNERGVPRVDHDSPTDMQMTRTEDVGMFPLGKTNHSHPIHDNNNWPIDPGLQPCYPTLGPNDPVPHGCFPVPPALVPADTPSNTGGGPPDVSVTKQTLAAFRERLDAFERAMAVGNAATPSFGVPNLLEGIGTHPSHPMTAAGLFTDMAIIETKASDEANLMRDRLSTPDATQAKLSNK